MNIKLKSQPLELKLCCEAIALKGWKLSD